MSFEGSPPIEDEHPTELKVHCEAKTNGFRLDGGKVNVQEIAEFFNLDASTMLVRRRQSDDVVWEKFGANRSTGMSLESFAEVREVWVKIDDLPDLFDYKREHEKFKLKVLQFLFTWTIRGSFVVLMIFYSKDWWKDWWITWISGSL